MNGVGSEVKNHALMRLVFKPVHESLIAVKGATKANVRDSKCRANILRDELGRIGGFVKNVIKTDSVGADGGTLEADLW